MNPRTAVLAAALLAAPLRAAAQFDGGTLPAAPDAAPARAAAALLELERAGDAARSAADLYYFSPEEADAAAAAAGFADGSPSVQGGFRWPWERRPRPQDGPEFAEDVPEALRRQTLADLAFVAGIRPVARTRRPGASELHRAIFGSTSGSDYRRYFQERVATIGLDSCGGGPAIACVIPMRGSSRMWLTPNYTGFDHPAIARVMVLYHEARHTETSSRNWPHARCPVPFDDEEGRPRRSRWTGAPLAGEPACDVTPFGAYGSSLIMLKNIQLYCANCSDRVKMDAGLYADDQLIRITDAEARERILADLYR